MLTSSIFSNACIMCVQYIGGGMFSARGGGGYTEVHQGDIVIHMGDIKSKFGDVQYIGGYDKYVRRYHDCKSLTV